MPNYFEIQLWPVQIWMDAQSTHKHRTDVVTTMSRSLQTGSTKIKTTDLSKWYDVFHQARAEILRTPDLKSLTPIFQPWILGFLSFSRDYEIHIVGPQLF